MTKVENEKGFLILEMTAREAYRKGCGVEDVIICDYCNNAFQGDDKVYYVAVLNQIMCPDCYKEWYEGATNYPEDRKYELADYKDFLEREESDDWFHGITVTSW